MFSFYAQVNLFLSTPAGNELLTQEPDMIHFLLDDFLYLVLAVLR